MYEIVQVLYCTDLVTTGITSVNCVRSAFAIDPITQNERWQIDVRMGLTLKMGRCYSFS